MKRNANGRQSLRGRFITFEGSEGAGKSTQVSLLVQVLRRAGIVNPLATREPGGSAGAESIRRLLIGGEPGQWDGITDALLHCAARRDHLVRTIWPALAGGRWVVCDRFTDSTLAYQGSGQGVDIAQLRALVAIVAGDFAPDLTIILNLPPKVGLERAIARENLSHRLNGHDTAKSTRYEKMDFSFHLRLARALHAIAAAEPNRCVMVDATHDIPTVHAAVRRAVAERLGVDLFVQPQKEKGSQDHARRIKKSNTENVFPTASRGESGPSWPRSS